jgi:hypothetical protein
MEAPSSGIDCEQCRRVQVQVKHTWSLREASLVSYLDTKKNLPYIEVTQPERRETRMAKKYLMQAQKDREKTNNLPEKKRNRLEDETRWTKLQESGYQAA